MKIPGTERISEILHEDLSQLNDDASFLGVERFPNESEECFRTRVAYAMQVQLGVPITGKMLLRMAYWNMVANGAAAQQIN